MLPTWVLLILKDTEIEELSTIGIRYILPGGVSLVIDPDTGGFTFQCYLPQKGDAFEFARTQGSDHGIPQLPTIPFTTYQNFLSWITYVNAILSDVKHNRKSVYPLPYSQVPTPKIVHLQTKIDPTDPHLCIDGVCLNSLSRSAVTDFVKTALEAQGFTVEVS